MFKYIVTWLIVNTYATPCEQPKPYEDEYGRIINSTMQLSLLCYKSDTTLKTKEFASRKEAVNFINKGESDSISFSYGLALLASPTLLNFKLDSIKIKK